MSKLLSYLKEHLPTDEYQKVVATARPTINYTLTRTDNLPLTASKMGGIGYWDGSLDYPTATNGKPMALLAQINFDDIDDGALQAVGLPTIGILAFYIDPYDADYDKVVAKKTHRCVYFADINKPSLSRDEQLAMFPAGAFYQDDKSDDGDNDDGFELEMETVRPLLAEFIRDYDTFLQKVGNDEACHLWNNEKTAVLACNNIDGLIERLTYMSLTGSASRLPFELTAKGQTPIQHLMAKMLQMRMDSDTNNDKNTWSDYADWYHPVAVGEYAMTFRQTTHYLLSDNNDFERHYGQAMYEWENKFGLDYHQLNELIRAEQGEDQLGGYPTFCQWDPRGDVMVDDVDAVLLLQNGGGADETIDIMWGDAGIGHFFIHPDDLANQHFDKAWHWSDCH